MINGVPWDCMHNPKCQNTDTHAFPMVFAWLDQAQFVDKSYTEWRVHDVNYLDNNGQGRIADVDVAIWFDRFQNQGAATCVT